MLIKVPLCWALLLLALIAGGVRAEENPCLKENADCVKVGKWEFSVAIGFGGRTNPIVSKDDIPIFLMPSISYYGKRFFWQTDTIGFTLFESEHSMFNLIGTVGYEQTYFNDWGVGSFSIEGGSGSSGGSGCSSCGVGDISGDIDSDADGSISPTPIPAPTTTPESIPTPTPTPTPAPLSGGDVLLEVAVEDIDIDDLHKRKMAALVGFEYIYDYEYLSLGVQVLQDVSSVHDGMQVRLAISSFIERERSAYSFSLGAEWKDGDTLDYYYGVRSNEVSDQRLAYRVDPGFSYYAKFDWRYRISKKWELRSTVHHRRFGEEIKNSPLVEDDHSTAVFIGGAYHF